MTSMQLTTMRAICSGGLLALTWGIFAAQPVAAQTFISRSGKPHCLASTCESPLLFHSAMLIERVGCSFDTRASRSNSPQLVRVVLRSVANSGGLERQRQELAFVNTFSGDNRKIYVVGTNPLFSISATEHVVVTAIATDETNNIKVECYAAGYSQP